MNCPNSYLINCDWLQLHVKAGTDFFERENPYYTFVRCGQSKIWKNIYNIKNTALGITVLNIVRDVQECVMEPGHGVLKLENNQLYCDSDLKGFVEKLLHHLDFKFVNITRLDIAMDFQKFYMDKSPNGSYQRVHGT